MNKTAEDFLYKKGISSDTTIGIEGDMLLTDLLNEFAAPPPASEGEMAGMVSIEGKAELHANEYYEKGSNSERNMTEHELWLNRKYNFMAGAKWALATLPTREPEGGYTKQDLKDYGKLVLKLISEAFFDNKDKAERFSDKAVFIAISETIQNFPLPEIKESASLPTQSITKPVNKI